MFIHLKPERLHRGSFEGGSECANRISGANILIALHSNYGSIFG